MFLSKQIKNLVFNLLPFKVFQAHFHHEKNVSVSLANVSSTSDKIKNKEGIFDGW